MVLKVVLGLSTVLVLAALSVGTTGTVTKTDVDQLIRAAEVARNKAASVGNEWRDTRKHVKEARAAAEEGKLELAIQLANQAKQEGELAYTQAMMEKTKATTVPALSPAPHNMAHQTSLSDASASAAGFQGRYGPEAIREGKELAFDRKKGNCLGCHMIHDGVSPGNLGPPLLMMRDRFPSKGALRAQIRDPAVLNPDTLMPLFGRYKILSDAEIDKIVEYLWSI